MAEKRSTRTVPPEVLAAGMTGEDFERRFTPTAELRLIRAAGDGGAPELQGYAAIFNTLSEDLGGWRERIAPGAFTRALKEKNDVRALHNHDSNFVWGRTGPGTLELNQDSHGLHVRILPPDAQWARDLLVTIDRGDVNQMSFGFWVPKNGDTWSEVDGTPVRTVLEAFPLADTSTVTYPAYVDTSVAVRGLTAFLKAEDPEKVREIQARAKAALERRRRALDLEMARL